MPNDSKVEEEAKIKRLFAAAESNDFETVKIIVEKEGVPASASNKQHETVAHIAAKNGNADILKYIVDKKPSVLTVKDRQNNTVLRLIIERKATQLLEYLESKYVSKKLSYRDFESAAVHAAIHYGHLDIVKHFLEEKKCDVNVRDEFEEPPVFTAIEERQIPVFKYLVEERNANLTLLDRYNSNILFELVRIDQLPLFKYVLDEQKVPLNVNWQNVFNDTVLHKAALWNRRPIIEYLVVEKGADVNVVNDNGMTPLHVAAWKEFYEVCEFLVEHGADARMTDKEGKTAAERTAHQKLAEYLKNATTSRTRRSLYRRLGPSSSQTIVRPCESWRREINVVDFFPPTGLLGGGVENSPPADTYSTQFNNLLVIVESIVKNASHRNANRPRFASRDPVLHDRFDPVAVDAVNAILDFSKNDR